MMRNTQATLRDCEFTLSLALRGSQAAAYPPSTGKMAPVTKDAASDVKNKTGPAISSGFPQRPNGGRDRIGADRAGSSRRSWVNVVAIHPGATAFTRIPSGAHATANDRVSCAIAPLLALYAGARGPPN